MRKSARRYPRTLAAIIATAPALVGGAATPAVAVAGHAVRYDPMAVVTTSTYIEPVDRGNPADDDDPSLRMAQFTIVYDSNVPSTVQPAVNRAAALWGAVISSPVPIKLHVSWASTASDVAAQAGPTTYEYINGVWYPIALANAKQNTDNNGTGSEIEMTLGNAVPWYYGTDGAVPTNKVDLVTVVMHEIGHGLGYISSLDYSGGVGTYDTYPFIYETFIRNASGTPIRNYSNNSTALGSQLTSDALYFDGPYADAAAGSARAKIFAPSPWDSGSSISHLDEDTYATSTANALMSPAVSYGEAVHDPGPIGVGVLRDLGWPRVSGFYGTRGTYFADVTGDGKADAIAVNDGKVTVRRSNGKTFGSNEYWTTGAFYGTRGTFFVDMNADGKADAVAVNDTNIGVRLSNGSAFGTNSHWYSGTGWYGSVGTYFADVTGDGKADAIAVNSNHIGVMPSTGTDFGTSTHWTSNGYYGSVGTYFADVTGDGKADAIAVNSGGVTVRVSSGSGFGSNQAWTSSGYYGTHGTYFADVTGDDKADAIVLNSGGVTVRRAGTSSFGSNETWTSSGYYGTREEAFADTTGDGKADAVVVNNDGITVRRANTGATAFNANEYWTG